MSFNLTITGSSLADKSGYSTPYFICFSNKVIISDEISRLRFVNVIYLIFANLIVWVELDVDIKT